MWEIRDSDGLGSSSRILIGMIFLAEEAVGFLDLSIRGRFVDVQEFVEVFDTEDDWEEKS